MPAAVEPGTRLAGRYRLLEPVGAPDRGAPAPGTAYWRAHDELLNRSVGVRVLTETTASADAVLHAAQQAATVQDPRFLAVLDADRGDGLAYVVTEWCDATDLAGLLARGPLPAADAHWIAAEVARGLTHAHAAGLAHRRLVPEAVLRDESGSVKIAGLAVDAALRGMSPYADARAEESDLWAAGAVLYAALTGRWPLAESGQRTRLPPAPVVDGAPCAPRQVRAAVPAALDELACRALGAPLRRGTPPLRSTGELAAALTGAPGTLLEASTGPLPAVAPEGSGAASADTEAVRLLAAPARSGAAGRAAVAAVTALLLLGLGLLSWQVITATAQPGRPAPAQPAESARPADPEPAGSPPGAPVPVVRAVDFDPEGSNGEEYPDRVPGALDGDPDTAWTTEEYYNSPLGGLKSGVGLVLDLGGRREVATVSLRLLGWGSDVELRAAPAAELPADADGFAVVADAEQVGSLVTLRPEEPVRARYLLVWFTSLPLSGEDRYRGGIADVQVRS